MESTKINKGSGGKADRSGGGSEICEKKKHVGKEMKEYKVDG